MFWPFWSADNRDEFAEGKARFIRRKDKEAFPDKSELLSRIASLEKQIKLKTSSLRRFRKIFYLLGVGTILFLIHVFYQRLTCLYHGEDPLTEAWKNSFNIFLFTEIPCAIFLAILTIFVSPRIRGVGILILSLISFIAVTISFQSFASHFNLFALAIILSLCPIYAATIIRPIFPGSRFFPGLVSICSTIGIIAMIGAIILSIRDDPKIDRDTINLFIFLGVVYFLILVFYTFAVNIDFGKKTAVKPAIYFMQWTNISFLAVIAAFNGILFSLFCCYFDVWVSIWGEFYWIAILCQLIFITIGLIDFSGQFLLSKWSKKVDIEIIRMKKEIEGME